MLDTILTNIFYVFTTREIAIIIWLFIFILIILISTIFNKSLKKSFDDIIDSLFSSYIVVPVLIIIIYSLLITMILINLSFWKNIYFKELLVWFLFSGIFLVFRSVTSESFIKFYREYFLDQFKIIIFFIPIILSLLFFPLAYFFALFSLYEKTLNIVMYLLPNDKRIKSKTKYKIF